MTFAPLKDFFRLSPDLLKLLIYKEKSINKVEIREAEIIEEFYDMVQALIQRSELELQAERLMNINEHIKVVLLEKELKELYNTFYKANPAEAMKQITQSALPTKKELESNVVLR